MIPQMIEVNIRTQDSEGTPVPNVPLYFRSGHTDEFKRVITDALGRGQLLLLPCNSFWTYWTDTGGAQQSRVYVQYSIRRPGTPFNRKKLDLTVVVIPPEFVWAAETDYVIP